MDLNALKTMQNCQQPKRRELILEARHSKCIEASKQIRSKLSPRLFLPRAPLYRHPTKTQHCPKELKITFFKSQNLKIFNTNTDFGKETKSVKKCQTQNGESFVKRVKGKYTKKSQRRNNCKTMENMKEKGCKWPSKPDHKRPKPAEPDKDNFKGIKKQKKLQTAKKPKDVNKEKYANLKIIANENSTDNASYLTDGEIIFVADLGGFQTEKFQDFQMNVDDYDGSIKAITNYCLASVDQTNSNSEDYAARSSEYRKQCIANKSKTTTSEENFDSISICNSSKQCPSECSLENTGKGSSKMNFIKKFTNVSSQNIDNTQDLQATTKQKSTNTKDKKKCSPKLQLLNKNQKPAVSNCKQAIENKAGNSYNVTLNAQETSKLHAKLTSAESNTIPSSTKTTRLPKTYSTLCDLENSLLNLPISSYLNEATTAVADFQCTVKSSMSQINDGSPIDKTIHEDLIGLENCVESFSNCLRQCYIVTELEDSKTNNCVAYLNAKNMNNFRIQNQQLRSQNSTFNKPINAEKTQETLTICIEADTMPTKTITFNMSDIMQEKIYNSVNKNSSCDNFDDISKEQITNDSKNLKRKKSDVAIDSNKNLSNILTLNLIEFDQTTSLLNKEIKESTISKSSNQESYTTCVNKENTKNVLHTFVEDSIQKPAFGIGTSMETKCNKKDSLITGKNLSQILAEPQHEMQNIPLQIQENNTILAISHNTQTHNSNIELNTHNLNTTVSITCPQSQGFNNSFSSFTSPYNLIYTQAQTNCTPYITPNPLLSKRVNNFPTSRTSPAATLNPDSVYNSLHNSLGQNTPRELSPIHRTYFYPNSPYPTQEHQVPNESQLPASNHNHSNTNTIYTPPNFILNNPRTALTSVEVQNNSEHQKSFLRMPYLQSPYSYNHFCNLRPYNTQLSLNPSKYSATNVLPPRGFEITNHSVFNTYPTVQPFLNNS